MPGYTSKWLCQRKAGDEAVDFRVASFGKAYRPTVRRMTVRYMLGSTFDPVSMGLSDIMGLSP